MDKLTELKTVLAGLGNVCVAFSGGVDSALVLAVAVGAVGVIADGVMLPRRELTDALALADYLGAPCCAVSVEPLDVPEFGRNDRNRCYMCKRMILYAIKQKAAELGIRTVVDGTNADDEKVYRPGRQAALELGVVSPLAMAGFSKADVRAVSKQLGLPVWDKPGASCLATRLPYGTQLSAELLARVEAAEELLLAAGVRGARARVHGDLLRVEAAKDSFAAIVDGEAELTPALKRLGFRYITLDLEGFRSGSMD